MVRLCGPLSLAFSFTGACVAQSGTTSNSSAIPTTTVTPAAVETYLQTSGLSSLLGGNNNSTLWNVSRTIAQYANKYEVAIKDILKESGASRQKILDPEGYYSYGRSPPVYPSPQGPGRGGWADAYSKARSLVAQMTDDEKANITYGTTSMNGCSGFTGSVQRLHFPGICLDDSPLGVNKASQGVNSYPAGLHVGATWNRSLAYDRALHLGKEAKAKGINFLNGPVAGPLGRTPKGGRNWEGFSVDPYLAGSLVRETVTGMQKSIISCVKHYIANEQETNRNPFLQSDIVNLNNSVSSNVDDRTMHELYLWPFYDAVKAGAGSVMCSYNRVNNSYACQNSKTMNGLLKTELGFEGFIVSDWFGQPTGIASANAGLDMAMPSSQYWDDGQLVKAAGNGSVNSTRLDDMATRILAVWQRLAPLEKPGIDFYDNVDARDAEGNSTAFQSAVEGHVLVKNIGNILPLKKPKVLSVFGWDAVSGINTSSNPSSFLQGMSLSNTQTYPDGKPFTQLDLISIFLGLTPSGSHGPEIALNGTIIHGGGSGGPPPLSMTSPYDALKQQASIDGTILETDIVSQNPAVNSSDACLVFINAQSGESWDRSTLDDTYSDTLVTNVASKCPNTVVIIHNAGVRLVDRWIDNPNVKAVIFAHLPGQDSGNALVEVLYGRQSPSGRLPYTVAKRESDYGSLLNPTLPTKEDPQYSQSNFDEGLYVDYKHFIKNNIEPRFAFGFGLTYSDFDYSCLQIVRSRNASTSPLPPDANTSGVSPEGGLASLYNVLATVSINVKNAGKVAAAEVPQLYVGIPNSGLPKVLRGFDKHLIQSGETKTVTFPLTRRDLSLWDSGRQQWVLQLGAHDIRVGKNVDDIQLTGKLVF